MSVTPDELLQSNKSTVEKTLSQASQIASRIRLTDYLVNVSQHSLRYDPSKPNLKEPDISLSDLMPDGGFDNDTIKWLDTEAEKLIDKYFPMLNKCLRTKPEEWLCRVISGEDPYGYSQQMFDAVWNQARDNAYKTAQIEKNQIYTELSSRGFSIPIGAMVAAMAQAEEKASDTISAANKEIMINEINVKLDLLKFAVEQAIELKKALLSQIADFYKLFLQLPNQALEIAKAKADVMRAYYAAWGEYYNNQLGYERLCFNAAATQLDSENMFERLKIQAYQPDSGFNAANASVAEAFASVGSAAANANSMLIAQLEAQDE